MSAFLALSAPLLWIIFPALAGSILLMLTRWERLAVMLAFAVSLALALLAWKLPVGDVIEFGGRTFMVETALVFFGRRLVLLPSMQPLLVMIYLGAAFWFGGVYVARAGRSLAPVGLGVVALLTAALAVEPFLYAALLIEVTVLLCVPVLASSASPLGRGVLRFVILQTFGMPFILFTGYFLAGIESNPGDPLLSVRIGVLMGLGFGFLLAVFPFHSWLPMLAEESHPYLAAFVFLFLPQMVMLFGLGFVERYAWIRSVPAVFVTLRGASLLMIAIGSFWAAFQSHLGRMLGYAVMVETGFGLLALSTLAHTSDGLLLHFLLLPARAVAFSLYALGLAVIRERTGELSLQAVQGFGWRMPLATTGLLLAQLSLAGLPLLAGFPPRFALAVGLVVDDPFAAGIALLGGVGLLVAALRALVALFSGMPGEWMSFESRGQRFFFTGGIVLLFSLGLFAQRLLPWLQNVVKAFPRLSQ
ncbi:MAG: proton-conducting transporter membrane subunit [Chloroflexota bacterium]